MLDFQATDAVGMRVQSVAKVSGLPNLTVRGWRALPRESKGPNLPATVSILQLFLLIDDNSDDDCIVIRYERTIFV